MDSWFKNITSGEDAASSFKSLVKQAVSTVERNLDQVLDIQVPSEEGSGQDDMAVAAGLSSFLDFGMVPASSSSDLKTSDNNNKESDQDDFFSALLGGTSFAPKPAVSATKPVAPSPKLETPPVVQGRDDSQTKTKLKSSSILKTFGSPKRKEMALKDASRTDPSQSEVRDKPQEPRSQSDIALAESIQAKEPIPDSFQDESENPIQRTSQESTPIKNLHQSENTSVEEMVQDTKSGENLFGESAVSLAEPEREASQELDEQNGETRSETPHQKQSAIGTTNAAVSDSLGGDGQSVSKLEDALAQQKQELETNFLKEMDHAQRRIKELEIALQESKLGSSDSLSSSSAQLANMTRALAEKENSITGLLQEGEKLAKEILKSNNNVKKLRARESELEKELNSTTQKLTSAESQMQSLKDQVSSLTESERRLKDTIYNTQSSNDTQTQQIAKLEKELASEKAQLKDVTSSRDRAWKELSDVKQEMAEQSSVLQSEALEKANKKNQELTLQLNKLKADAETVEINLRRQNEELQAGLARIQDDLGWKEENWRREIETLEERLRASEARNEDLSSIGQSATKPLLRQIEALQAQFSESLKDAEQSERLLSARLQESERERASAVENERVAKAQILDLEAKIATQEVHVSHERKEKSRFLAELEALDAKNREMESEIVDVKAKMEVLNATFQKDLEQALASQAKKHEDRLKAEAEKWQVELELERKSRASLSEKTLKSPVNRQLSVPPASDPLLDTLSPTGNAAITIDRLQGQVKQLEGQISSLQAQLREATKTRDEMADQLYKTTNENEDLRAKMDSTQNIVQEHTELNARYNTVLEILGEKTERIDELQADIEDMKVAFRAQVQDLLGKLGQTPIQ